MEDQTGFRRAGLGDGFGVRVTRRGSKERDEEWPVRWSAWYSQRVFIEVLRLITCLGSGGLPGVRPQPRPPHPGPDRVLTPAGQSAASAEGEVGANAGHAGSRSPLPWCEHEAKPRPRRGGVKEAAVSSGAGDGVKCRRRSECERRREAERRETLPAPPSCCPSPLISISHFVPLSAPTISCDPTVPSNQHLSQPLLYHTLYIKATLCRHQLNMADKDRQSSPSFPLDLLPVA
ncbi:unnamed protein product [Pleuronectes platessa]|uniref:Uncharacterized protein n=1 Tax=Pleuronectes platessa TaxID=8262 RepID=A0A9N7TYJ6_PLEPL|nr:unnamed protein product [Pleuronectes platessa]